MNIKNMYEAIDILQKESKELLEFIEFIESEYKYYIGKLNDLEGLDYTNHEHAYYITCYLVLRRIMEKRFKKHPEILDASFPIVKHNI